MSVYLWELYERIVLKRPSLVLAFVAILLTFACYFAKDFRLDASGDSLVLENDQALSYYRSVRARYGSDDFLIITYSPVKDLFSAPVLDDLKALRDQLKQIERVDNVISILDVPLISSPPVTLSDLSKEIRTLETPGVEKDQARQELTTSPFYSNLIINPDASTTAIQVTFKRDDTWQSLFERRNELRGQRLEKKLTREESAELKRVEAQFDAYSDRLRAEESADIASVRAIMDKHRHMAELHLGGVTMIVSDSMDYVRSDLSVFGIGVVLLMTAILLISFRRPRWVVLPLMTCGITTMFMLGLLGFLDWRVTVVSSNFVSLLLIITMSLNVHLIVRYRELRSLYPQWDQHRLVKMTVRSKAEPSFFTAITTIVAFGSLTISDIRPVIDFGWMMTLGITFAFIFAFTFFPAALMLLKPGKPIKMRNITGKFIRSLSIVIRRRRYSVVTVFMAVGGLSIVGLSQLSVENRFIDYFKKNTEIYQGMELIDRELGGTTPLDVVIDAPKSFFEEDEAGDEIEDDYLIGSRDAGITGSSYWFNSFQLGEVRAIHEYLDSLPETGKVLSINTTMDMMSQLKDGKQLDDFFLSILYNRLPDEIKQALFTPYMSSDGNQLLFSIRVFESDPNLKREVLLDKIRDHLTTELNLSADQVQVTGMLVLYNNMLKSLFRSQILTIGAVFLAILAMFALLFRSLRMATLAIIPNLLAASMVLGLMGLAGIPLDMMTITIAAICIGIAVDDTIHYVHRFTEEFEQHNDYWKAIRLSHDSIGRAMYYTSLIITLGFSILALSNFVPTIYFGLLTGFAMIVALLANLTLLPLLIESFKPMGPDKHAPKPA
jgi:predicted RND superfamily exporter protein